MNCRMTLRPPHEMKRTLSLPPREFRHAFHESAVFPRLKSSNTPVVILRLLPQLQPEEKEDDVNCQSLHCLLNLVEIWRRAGIEARGTRCDFPGSLDYGLGRCLWSLAVDTPMPRSNPD